MEFLLSEPPIFWSEMSSEQIQKECKLECSGSGEVLEHHTVSGFFFMSKAITPSDTRCFGFFPKLHKNGETT